MNRGSNLRKIECVRLVSEAETQFALLIENPIADRVHLEEYIFAAEEGEVRVLAVRMSSKFMGNYCTHVNKVKKNDHVNKLNCVKRSTDRIVLYGEQCAELQCTCLLEIDPSVMTNWAMPERLRKASCASAS